MKNLIIRLVLVVLIFTLLPSANIAHAEGGYLENYSVSSGIRNAPAAAAPGLFIVSPKGSPSNAGTYASPWDLQTALNHPAAIAPGSTIWLLEGTYTGQFTNRLKGTAEQWIAVQNFPNHRVILTNSSGPALDIANSQYVVFWGLEVASNFSTRSTSRSESTYGIRVRQGDSSHHLRFVNMIIHDNQAQGIGWWQALKDTEIYGSLFYYNGTTQLDHGVYTHNVSGRKFFTNNIVFNNASHGFHGYAETAEKGLNNITIDSNTFFSNGSIGINTKNGVYGNYKRNILVGGLVKASNTVITNNTTYFPGNEGGSLNLGYTAGSSNSVVTNNYFAGGTFTIGGSTSNLTMTGNVIFAPGGISGVSATNYPQNTWVINRRPAMTRIYVRPNAYDRRRANITIYNWPKNNTVAIPASQLGGVNLKPGQAYELRNVQDYFGDIIKGVYDGNAIIVPMTNRSVAQPMGLNFKPPSTFPEFGVFVLIGK